jgi:ABC-type Fe3+/spermidine/putrescine transport system ATPase subunit
MIMDGLEIKDIKKAFEKNAVLTGISFQVSRGEIVAILGPSGSGKTTLLEVIAGLVEPDFGDVLWNGNSLLETPTHLRNFGLMFQEYVLFPHKNVGDNIAFGLKMAGDGKQNIISRVSEVLELVGLPGYDKRDVNTLSGGEQQRVALARSLAPEPRMVMLDEPLGALDRTIREKLVTELREILKKARQTALYVTHDQEEAFSIADRIVILGEGTTAQIGTAQEIYYQPNSLYVAKFLGMDNAFHGNANLNDSGSEIITDLGSWQTSKTYQGPGTVVLRPDKCDLKGTGSKKEADLTGHLTSSTFSGSSFQILVQINNQIFKFNLSNIDGDLPEIGEKVTIWFDPDQALHFYSDTP